MSRRRRVALALFVFATTAFAADPSLWREYGLVRTQTTQQGNLTVTSHEMKDVTGAIAAWESLRTPAGRSCNLASFCTKEPDRIVVADENYVLEFAGSAPTKPQVDAIFNALPNKRDSALPAILTFLPRIGLVPDSARYVLGPASLQAFAPELASAHPGFDQGAEAQVALYKIAGAAEPVHLALFYYPSPEMARLHDTAFQKMAATHVKRSAVLVGVVFGPASDAQAAALLAQVQYEAQVTRNMSPPPSPIKPLFQLLMNIMWLSIVLCAICLCAGLMYAGMRLYRRKYGTLEAQEAMTTLHLR